MNTYIVNGRVAKEAKLEKTQSGVSKLTLVIVSNTHVKEGESYLSHSVQAVFYGKNAELLSESVSKGTPLFVSGEMAHRSYVDKNDVKQYYEFLRVNHFDFLESKEMASLRQSSAARNKNEHQSEIGRGEDFEE